MRRALVGLGILTALLGWLGHAALAPIDHGTDRPASRDPEQAAVPVGPPIQPLPGARRPRPNFVVILADDRGWPRR